MAVLDKFMQGAVKGPKKAPAVKPKTKRKPRKAAAPKPQIKSLY